MPDAPAPPTLPGLFFGFLTVGMYGFGGTMPWARRMVVEQRRWMTPAEFTDMMGLCQFLPGGNILNLTVALGARFHGVAGSAAALFGVMAAPMTIVLALGVVYARYGGLPAVHAAFDALAAAASALVLATALKIAAPLRTRVPDIAVAVVTFAGIAVVRWPLPLVLAIVAPLSILIARRFRA
jgi:chromate transporter